MRAIAADEHDPTARHWYALVLQAVGREEEARRLIDAAYAIDPLIGAVSGVQGDLALSMGDYPAAEKAFARARALGIYGGSTYDLGRTRILAGDREGARPLMESRYGEEPGFDERMELLFAALEDPGAVRAYEAYVRENVPESVYVLRDVAAELLMLGSPVFFDLAGRIDCDQPPALLWIDRAAELRRDPRFEAFARRMGMADFWRDHGWPDKCASLNPDFAECD